jgi:hypothetical protein
MFKCPFGSPDWVCNDESNCFRCDEVVHANLHPNMDDPECMTCKLRTVQISPSCYPTSRNHVAPQGTQNNSWERGIARDHRGLPYRDASGNEIPIKRFAEKRSVYESAIRANRQGAFAQR